jgi:PmbA protein
MNSALSLSEFGSRAYFDFPGKGEVREQGLWCEEEASVSIDEMISLGGKVVEKLSKNWPDLICGSSVSSGRAEVAIANSKGFEGAFKSTGFGFGASVEASKQGDMFQWSTSFSGIPKDSDLDEFHERCNRNIELGLKVAHLDAGDYPVVLAPNSLPFLLRALEAGVKGDNVFFKKSPLTDRIGEAVISDKLTITDDPDWDVTSKTVPFDDEGVITSKQVIFENGVFKQVITDLEFAARLGISPTGHGYRQGHIYRDRSLAGGASIGSGNWRISAGDVSLDEMLSEVGTGVYVDCSFDCWMGNIISGDFSGTLHRAYKIEDGKLVGRLKHRAFTGNIYDVLGKDLKAVGSKVEKPDLGFDTVEAPHLLIGNMNIA